MKKLRRSSASKSRATIVPSAEGPSRYGLGLLLRKLGQLGLELQVDAARPVLDRDDRLRRQRLERGGKRARVVPKRPALVEVREQRAQVLDLLAERRRRPTSPASRPARAGARRARGRRRGARARASRGRARGRRPARSRRGRRASASTSRRPPRSWRPVPGTSTTRTAAGVTFFAPDEARELGEPLVGDRRHPDVRLLGHGRVGGDLGAGVRQRVEERRLARVREPDDADLESHGREAIGAAGVSASAGAGARRARDAGAT